LEHVTHPANEQAVYTYDPQSRLTQVDRPGNLRSNYTFDFQNVLASIGHKNENEIISYFNYSRDLGGSTTGAQSSNSSRQFQYDLDTQLTAVTSSEVTPENYTYDSVYNRTTDSVGAYTYDSKKQRLTEDYRNFYFYDDNGNLISKQEKGMTGTLTRYNYSSENQLVAVSIYESGSSIPVLEAYYEYNGLGQRVGKRIVDHSPNGHSASRFYVYQNDEILLEYDDQQQILVSYQHSGLRTDDIMSARVTTAGSSAAIAPVAGLYRFLKDSQGSITEIINSSNQLVERIQYSSFGVLLKRSDANGAPSTNNFNFLYAYVGRELDRETGLYYFRARHYDPNIGRFIQEDPSPGKTSDPSTIVNRYSYAVNSPSNYVDPSGRFPWLIVGIFAVIGAVQNFKTASDAGGSFQQILLSTLTGAATGTLNGLAATLGGFWTAVGVNYVGGALNNGVNQALFKGEVDSKEFFLAGFLSAGLGAALGAGASFGVNKLLGGYLTVYGSSVSANAVSQFATFLPTFGTIVPSGVPQLQSSGCTAFSTGGQCSAVYK
jgi:RHS repeat-associated protein